MRFFVAVAEELHLTCAASRLRVAQPHLSQEIRRLERELGTELVDLTSAGPARVYGIARKGRIAMGYDADLTIVDLKRRETITDRWIASRAGWTPYNDMSVTGWPVATLVRGRKVMWDGEIVTPPAGEAVRFGEAMPRMQDIA